MTVDEQVTGAWEDTDYLVVLLRGHSLVVIRKDWGMPSIPEIADCAKDLFPDGAPFKFRQVTKEGRAPLGIARSLAR